MLQTGPLMLWCARKTPARFPRWPHHQKAFLRHMMSIDVADRASDAWVCKEDASEVPSLAASPESIPEAPELPRTAGRRAPSPYNSNILDVRGNTQNLSVLPGGLL